MSVGEGAATAPPLRTWLEVFGDAVPRVRAVLDAELEAVAAAAAAGAPPPPFDAGAAAAAVWAALRGGAPFRTRAGPAERRAAARRLADEALGPCALAPGEPLPRGLAARVASLWVLAAKLAEDLFAERAASVDRKSV